MSVDIAFEALGDRTRRQILSRLASGPASVGELAEALPVGRPAVSMSLRVLRDAGLVAARADGNRRVYQLDPDALAALRDYLAWYWAQALETFKQHVEAEGGQEMDSELRVTKSIAVDVPAMRAFQMFLDQGHWWPVATHHIAHPAGETVVLEPYPGGRWYERGADGTETDWGRVIAFEPPRRILLSWQVSPEWEYEPDPARASEIEVTFIAETQRRTRIVLAHRHIERYGGAAEHMREVLDRPGGAAAVLTALDGALTADGRAPSRRQPTSSGGSRA
jgi:DNA-binding transcriptional ArsR family regulator/uncharacterized protein YndB with AHSA1/START domain